MPTNITPVNEFDATTALARPAPGERVGMETGASPLAPLLQRLADHDHTLRLGLLGQMAGGDRMSVDAGGSSTVFTVRISQVRSLLLQEPAGSWYATSTAGETTLDLTDVDGAPAALANSTWYYVYAYCVGTATTVFYIATDPPDDALVWEATSPGLRRYVGCFRTGAAGAPLPMRMVKGRYVYQKSALGTALRIDGTTIPTSHTAVSVAPLAPPHVRTVKIGIEVLNTDATNWGAVEVRTAGDSGDVYRRDCPPAGAAHDGYAQAEFECLADGSQEVEWQRLSASSYAAITGGLCVLGFTE